MSLSQGFKERLERKSKHLGLSSSPDSVFPVPKTFNTEGREVVDHPVKAKVLTMVAKGHSDMEGYGKRLHDKLEQFEREFSEQVRVFLLSTSALRHERLANSSLTVVCLHPAGPFRVRKGPRSQEARIAVHERISAYHSLSWQSYQTDAAIAVYPVHDTRTCHQ